jgi:hypothetical protein
MEEVRRMSISDMIQQLTGQGVSIEIAKDDVPHRFEELLRSGSEDA